VGKPGGKKPLGTPSHTLEIRIKLAVKEVGWENVKRIHLAQDRDK
jgi:hypothetical protein